ncbi:MAG TPA: hypothetical protein VF026_02825 [Ktedonobacteraceae bacterium]
MWRYLIAIVLLAHGIGHIMPFMAAWTPQRSQVGFSDAPWIFSGSVGVGSPIGQAFGLLGLVALIGFVAGALGLVTQQAWWPTVTIAAAAISIVTIVPWVTTWPPASMIGALLVDAAVLAALLPPWGQQLVHAL